MASDLRPTYDLSKIPQQTEFLTCQQPFPLYAGGYNNGKTFALCLKALELSGNYPGNCGVIGRLLLKDLGMSTRKTLFGLLGCNDATIRYHPRVKSWNASKQLLIFDNDSEIYFVGLANAHSWDSIKGANLRWFGIDQAEQVPEAAIIELLGRLGRTESIYPKWGGMVANPAGHNWLWRWYKKYQGTDKQNPEYPLIEARTKDNPWVGKDYIRTLEARYSKEYIQRYVHGSWDTFTGQVYDDFMRDVHVIEPFKIPEDWKCGMGADFGWENPTCFLWFARDYDGNYHLYNEHYESRQTPEYHVKRIREKGILKNGEQLPIYSDPAMLQHNMEGKTLRDVYRSLGIGLTPGVNRQRLAGILNVKQLLRVDEDKYNPYNERMGMPKLMIHSHCVNAIEEMMLYRWKDNKGSGEYADDKPEEPVKRDDHAMDALRYFFMSWGSELLAERVPEPTVAQQDRIVFSHPIDNQEDWTDWRGI